MMHLVFLIVLLAPRCVNFVTISNTAPLIFMILVLLLLFDDIKTLVLFVFTSSPNALAVCLIPSKVSSISLLYLVSCVS